MRCCSTYLFILLEHVRLAKWLRPRLWQRGGIVVCFKEEKDELKFYKAELASMDLRKTPELRVDYLHIKKYTPQLAYALIAEPGGEG
ncbi:hypothetical protein SETIT_4G025200v2 [Setaria italica]|uniref:MCM N-terminal domain-containing protein n=1 Tax=Setaria italica TaxID=4555 RepID=A0A368QPZ9_SETIT|nr:hypothetical protein SETIT_4G025200v2 [Setaria italica]